MPVPAQDKPLVQLRQEVIDQLVLNYGHERISKEAFERRLDEAYDAKTHDELVNLTNGLDAIKEDAYASRRDHLLYAEEAEKEESELIVNVFSGTERSNEGVVPSFLKIINIFGGAEIDYSLALFSSRETHIKTINIFGGAEIYVPEGVRVKTRVIPIFGGTSNKSEPDTDPEAPVVIISGLNLFGGISISVKRTFRERMQNFADDIKDMLH